MCGVWPMEEFNLKKNSVNFSSDDKEKENIA